MAGPDFTIGAICGHIYFGHNISGVHLCCYCCREISLLDGMGWDGECDNDGDDTGATCFRVGVWLAWDPHYPHLENGGPVGESRMGGW